MARQTVQTMITAQPSPWTGVPGWLTTDEEHCLIDYAVQVPRDGMVVNIGVEYGRSLAALAKHAPIPYVLGIDIVIKPEAIDALNKAGLSERYHLVGEDSYNVGKRYADKKISLLFIDGDHSINGVRRDIDAWLPHVAVGGIAVFHDTAYSLNTYPHVSHIDVSTVVNEWYFTCQGEWVLDRIVDSIMSFKRVK